MIAKFIAGMRTALVNILNVLVFLGTQVWLRVRNPKKRTVATYGLWASALILTALFFWTSGKSWDWYWGYCAMLIASWSSADYYRHKHGDFRVKSAYLYEQMIMLDDGSVVTVSVEREKDWPHAMA